MGRVFICLVRCGVAVFRRFQPTLEKTDECHLPERAVDLSCDQGSRKVVSLLGREITVRDRLVGAQAQDQFDSMLRNSILPCRCGYGEAQPHFNNHLG